VRTDERPTIDGLEALERSGSLAHLTPPVLVVVPDPEAKADPAQKMLGRVPLERLAHAAIRVGFSAVYLAPGTKVEPRGAIAVATGDRVDAPALVVFEGSAVHPELLDLMVAHPLEDDERYTLYDEVGRPAAAFVGRLRQVPSSLPISEELPWPEPYGPADVVRVVYDEDRRRAEGLILRAEQVLDVGASMWRRLVGLPTLRALADGERPLPQLELAALAAATLSLPLALLGEGIAVVAAALALLVGVHTSKLLRAVRALRRPIGGSGDEAGERLARATRPLGHAALLAGLSYVLVGQTDRSGVAAIVLLGAGAAATLLCLAQARLLLRGRSADTFALPDARAVAARIGARMPDALEGAPVLEIAVLLAALPGRAVLPWSVLAASAAARLWRWFSGPADPTSG
jgi:hypothetical protein